MILDLLKKRYSCRGFADEKIPGDVIKYIVECGRLAPSGGNEQPWKFGIITDKGIIDELAKASSILYDQSWIASAPLVIVLCTQIFNYDNEDTENMDMKRFPSFHERIRHTDKKIYALISMEGYMVNIPGENMVIAAMERGVYSTWIGAVNCEMAAELLDIAGYYVTSMIAFGYPKAEREPTPKKNIEDITFTNNFNKKGVIL